MDKKIIIHFSIIFIHRYFIQSQVKESGKQKTLSEPLNSFGRASYRQKEQTPSESSVNAGKSHRIDYDENNGQQNMADNKQEKNRIAILTPMASSM